MYIIFLNEALQDNITFERQRIGCVVDNADVFLTGNKIQFVPVVP